MIKPQYNLITVKEIVKSFYEKPVDVRVNLGRNKIVNFSGILTGIYPALFTISPDDIKYNGRTSYSYSEILCGNVKLKTKASANEIQSITN
jgi:uncharacterized protein Veg